MNVAKPRKKRSSAEKRIQWDIVKNLRSLGFFVTTFSQPFRAAQTAGIPDLLTAHSRWLRGGMWIEVKDPKRRTELRGGCSLEQVQWHNASRDCGMRVVVAYSWSDVAAELRQLGMPL